MSEARQMGKIALACLVLVATSIGTSVWGWGLTPLSWVGIVVTSMIIGCVQLLGMHRELQVAWFAVLFWWTTTLCSILLYTGGWGLTLQSTVWVFGASLLGMLVLQGLVWTSQKLLRRETSSLMQKLVNCLSALLLRLGAIVVVAGITVLVNIHGWGMTPANWWVILGLPVVGYTMASSICKAAMGLD